MGKSGSTGDAGTPIDSVCVAVPFEAAFAEVAGVTGADDASEWFLA